MGELGLGSVLADSMGLGKAIQLIAHLVLLGEEAGPHLVVCPTSVVGNWGREIARFAPGLVVTRHHGPDRPLRLDGVAGVVLTSYGTLRRDAEVLAAVDWDTLTLDEAQFVKNPSTAAARAVRRLRARQRLALTGTPLENRLGELWALLDAVNPGLLGSRGRFTRRFVTPIEQRGDTAAARRLRRLVAPFVLRREKTDPTVIADLPEKIERTVVAALTPEQAALYQSAVDRALRGGALSGTTAMERRGRVLALLTELKQICNHPAQYLRERERTGRPQLGGRSGKLALAREVIAEATASGAQVLVFTQYVEMGHLLVEQLADDLGTEVPFLHGGVPAAARDRMVAGFQGESDAPAPPVFVVSLRAGGTGLNLTAATHVVHFDRWWNPAVEDQATDRAHRIGQSETVEVHKLVTAGTVEERVAEVLERKRELAEAVVGAGEAWLTELGDAELADLVALAADAPIADVDDDADLEAIA
jgi:SNF2 family DNA or RNA helicase